MTRRIWIPLTCYILKAICTSFLSNEIYYFWFLSLLVDATVLFQCISCIHVVVADFPKSGNSFINVSQIYSFKVNLSRSNYMTLMSRFSHNRWAQKQNSIQLSIWMQWIKIKINTERVHKQVTMWIIFFKFLYWTAQLISYLCNTVIWVNDCIIQYNWRDQSTRSLSVVLSSNTPSFAILRRKLFWTSL
jgi:hypothetical protein